MLYNNDMFFNKWNPPTTDNFRTLVKADQGVPASFGCSFTEGVGVEIDQTWSFLLDVCNCGLNGASNDKICRTAIEYCNTFNPEKIYVMWTFSNRREIVDQDNKLLKFKAVDPGSSRFAWHKASLELTNQYSDFYNYKKNKLMLESFCIANNIKLHQADVVDIKNDQQASDKQHPGPLWHNSVFELYQSNSN
jgi:hypothetical protein